MRVSYATQTIQPHGAPDPASPVAAGQIAFEAVGVPAGRSLAWSVTRAAASQSGALASDAEGNVSATVTLPAGLAEHTAEMGAASWDDGSPPCRASSGQTAIALNLV